MLLGSSFGTPFSYMSLCPSNSRILPGTKTRSLAIAVLIWYSAHEEVGLREVTFVGAEKLLKTYITYITIALFRLGLGAFQSVASSAIEITIIYSNNIIYNNNSHNISYYSKPTKVNNA